MAEHSKRKAARAMLIRSGYKVGGHVKGAVEKGVHQHEEHDHKGEKKTKLKLKHGGHAEGEEPKHRADKLARGGKAKGHGHGKVTVNVINAHPHPHPVPVPVPAGGPPPGMDAGPGGPGGPMPPPGAGPGGPPMPPPGPMHRGGRARGAKEESHRDEKGGMPKGHFKRGGKIPHMSGGAGGGKGRLEKAKAYGA